MLASKYLPCRFFTLKHSSSIFFEGGTIGKRVEWNHDEELFQRWRDGMTGMPLVDANMRELKETGLEYYPLTCHTMLDVCSGMNYCLNLISQSSTLELGMRHCRLHEQQRAAKRGQLPGAGPEHRLAQGGRLV